MSSDFQGGASDSTIKLDAEQNSPAAEGNCWLYLVRKVNENF